MKFYLISFDLEATGLSKFNDRIAELGATYNLVQTDDKTQSVTKNESLESFSEYANPGKPMHPEASKITGLTDDFLSQYNGVAGVLARFVKHTNKVCSDDAIPRILISYNGLGFDIPMLIAEAERCQEEDKTAMGSNRLFRLLRLDHHVDVLKLGRACLDTTQLKRKSNGRPSFKLGDVYKCIMSRELDGAHGAIADSQATTDVVLNDARMLQGLACCCFSGTTTTTTGSNATADSKEEGQEEWAGAVDVPSDLIRRVQAAYAKQQTRRQGGGLTILDMLQNQKNKKKKNKKKKNKKKRARSSSPTPAAAPANQKKVRVEPSSASAPAISPSSAPTELKGIPF